LAGLTRFAAGEETLSPADTRAAAQVVRQFMQEFAVRALSVAVAKQGRLVYRESFGEADEESRQPATPDSRFRIANVTKPFTSAAIFSLQELGQLHISDRLFGPNTVVGHEFGTPHPDGFGHEITIEHLLTHTCGGWQNDENDPMFLHPEMGHAQLIHWTLEH
jgi:CubicO group peptidase (beta-lactamase class C family)